MKCESFKKLRVAWQQYANTQLTLAFQQLMRQSRRVRVRVSFFCLGKTEKKTKQKANCVNISCFADELERIFSFCRTFLTFSSIN